MKYCKVLFLAVVFSIFYIGSAMAHWMPESEMYIGGVGHECTLAYVKGIFGEPAEKKWFNNDGFRGVRYIYSPTFSVTARVGANVPTPEDQLQVTNVNLKASNLDTPSGLTVGIPYQTVAGMFGLGEKKQFSDRVFYYYPIEGTNRAMFFYVNNLGIITEMVYAEEW